MCLVDAIIDSFELKYLRLISIVIFICYTNAGNTTSSQSPTVKITKFIGNTLIEQYLKQRNQLIRSKYMWCFELVL